MNINNYLMTKSNKTHLIIKHYSPGQKQLNDIIWTNRTLLILYT